ncbi:Uncharacterised protein [uncultured archaeon]|nr:Uncharacterised protein [uncultured archaeon]
MKIEKYGIMLVLTLSLVMGVAHAASALDGALSLSNLTVSPNPIVAGGNVTIQFQLYNSYSGGVSHASLDTFGSYPIFNASPQRSQNVGYVQAGLNPTRYTYTFSVSSTVPSGMYKVFFNSTYDALGSQEVVAFSSMPVSFYVQNKPSVKVVASGPQPAALYSGYNQTVGLMVQNTGYGTARNVSVRVYGGQGISLLSSVTTFFISNLTQGSSVIEPVLVSATNVGTATLFANVSYYSSSLNQRFYGVDAVNLSTAPAAQFGITGETSALVPGSTNQPVTLTIRNQGTTEAQQVQLSMQSTYPVTPIASTFYVSDLQPGASANVTFLVNIDTQGAAGTYPISVYEQWKQPNGATSQQFSGSNNYFILVNSPGGLDGTSYVIVAAVAIVAGFFVYKRFAGGKSKAKGAKEKEKK